MRLYRIHAPGHRPPGAGTGECLSEPCTSQMSDSMSGEERMQSRAVAQLARRVRRLASREGQLFLRALCLLVEVDLRLRVTGFARLQAALRLPVGAPAAGQEQDQLRQAYEMALALRRAAPFVPRARCLHRALSLSL